MSKNFFATLIVAVVATFAGYNIYQAQRAVTMSNLTLANVEALANDEGESGWTCSSYVFDRYEERRWDYEGQCYGRTVVDTYKCSHSGNCW